MGAMVHFSCKQCGYHKTFFVGTGRMTYDRGFGDEYILYNCPNCGKLKEVTKEIGTEDIFFFFIDNGTEDIVKCSKCHSVMNAVYSDSNLTDGFELKCPKCKSQDCECERFGFWD